MVPLNQETARISSSSVRTIHDCTPRSSQRASHRFSPPVLDRALHAIMSGYVRQRGDESQSHSPYPYPQDLIDSIRDVIRRRIEAVDREELNNFEESSIDARMSGADGNAPSGEPSDE